MKLRIHPTLAHPVAAALTVAAVQLLALAAATLFLLASCADSTDSADDTPSSPVPLAIRSVSTDDGAAPATRATALTTGTIGVFRDAQPIDPALTNSAYIAECVNYPYTYKANADGMGNPLWTARDADKTVYLTKDEVQLYAYYPYYSGTTYADKTALPIRTSVGGTTPAKYASNDFCYGTTTASAVYDVASFTMRHALARLEIVPTKLSGTATLKLSNMIFEHPSLRTSATVDITNNGALANPVADDDGKLTLLYGNPEDLYGSFRSVYAILVPFELNGTAVKITFTRTFEDKSTRNYSLTIPATDFRNGKMEAGNNYKITISMAADAGAIGTVEIGPWTEKDINKDNPFPL